MTFKIRDTELADETIRPVVEFVNTKENSYGYFLLVSLLIVAFNFVILCVALITIGTKGYDPFIHGSSMFISVFTLGCICAIHKYILGG